MQSLDIATQLELFAENDSWNQLPLSFWEQCQSYGCKKMYSAQQYLFFSGEEVLTVHFLLKGRVKLILMNKSSGRIFRVVHAPAFLSEVILDGKNYPYSALAVEDSEVLTFEKKDLICYISKNPFVLDTFYRNMAIELRRSYVHIRNLTLGDARSRLGSELFALAFSQGQGAKDGTQTQIPFSITELAEISNISCVSITRFLKEMKQRKIIDMECKRIKIYSKDLLVDWINERLNI